mmetsp:Transcript_39483/g.96680  ORF Transcript_39483/g.96680 Transcript_39483/m.96680 type:complete len:200 (-) Transcript_39483:680-1279(-)
MSSTTSESRPNTWALSSRPMLREPAKPPACSTEYERELLTDAVDANATPPPPPKKCKLCTTDCGVRTYAWPSMRRRPLVSSAMIATLSRCESSRGAILSHGSSRTACSSAWRRDARNRSKRAESLSCADTGRPMSSESMPSALNSDASSPSLAMSSAVAMRVPAAFAAALRTAAYSAKMARHRFSAVRALLAFSVSCLR